jgi:hypothetical protein
MEQDLAQPVHHAVGPEREPRVPLQVFGWGGQRVVLAQVAQLFPAQRVQRARRAIVHSHGVLPEMRKTRCQSIPVRDNV